MQVVPGSQFDPRYRFKSRLWMYRTYAAVTSRVEETQWTCIRKIRLLKSLCTLLSFSAFYSSDPARCRGWPSQPIMGHPFGRLEKGGSTYRPSQDPSSEHDRPHNPNTLQ